jgi:hypothetical protein
MTTSEVNLTVEQGATFTRRFQVKKDGTPSSLTGWSLYAQMRKEPGGDLVESFTLTPDNQTTDPGEVDIGLSVEETTVLLRGLYAWDFFRSKDGVVEKLAFGVVCVTARTTEI